MFKRKLYFFNHLIDPVGFPVRDLPENMALARQYLSGHLQAPIEIDLAFLQKVLATINSYYGFFIVGNTFRLRKTLYEKHFHHLKKYIVPKTPDHKVLKILPKYRK